MAGKKNNSFSRRLPDVVTKELVFVLSQKTSYEFKPLFEVVHDNLRRRNAAHGGEELLRLRAYEKLHNLVYSGAVKKNGKLFTGNSAALDAMTANDPPADHLLRKGHDRSQRANSASEMRMTCRLTTDKSRSTQGRRYGHAPVEAGPLVRTLSTRAFRRV